MATTATVKEIRKRLFMNNPPAQQAKMGLKLFALG
jgi:hypothetical protein